MVHTVAEFVAALLDAFARQVVLGFGLLGLVGAILFFFQRWTQGLLARALGWRGVVYWTGWLGTPIHELSHVVVGALLGVRITEVKLFQPDPRSGVLGYVRYEVPRLRLSQLHKVVGTFLMGVAPLFGGALTLLGALWLLAPQPEPVFQGARGFAELAATAPPADLGRAFLRLLQLVYAAVFADGLGSPLAWVFLYLALAVGAHLAPSRADLSGGLGGLLVLCGLALLADAVALLAGADPARAAGWLARATAPLTAVLLVALVLNCGNLALAGLLAGISRRVGRRRSA